MKTMKTTHQIHFQNAKKMAKTAADSIDLMVTSPPYPMIEMWDETFISQNPKIDLALQMGDGPKAFELMNQELDKVWKEVWRVMKPGGIACVNIGDATRTIKGDFALYASHSRIVSAMLALGFSMLPAILWRKQTNAPNKFMGSGMYPPGAYVTLEHEFVLIFRKGGKREFNRDADKQNRRASAYFWEERNQWFSDVWMELKGTRQGLFEKKTRQRSAAFPFELPYRLINMFSVIGDTVLDPFLGIGTTTFAAMASARNSVGYEIEKNFSEAIFSKTDEIVSHANERLRQRVDAHLEFVRERTETKGPCKHTNHFYGFPVITKQEADLVFQELLSVEQVDGSTLNASYAPLKLDADAPRAAAKTQKSAAASPGSKKKQIEKDGEGKKAVQLSLLD
jgi:modification methylase